MHYMLELDLVDGAVCTSDSFCGQVIKHDCDSNVIRVEHLDPVWNGAIEDICLDTGRYSLS